MCRRLVRLIFLSLVFISGVLVGGINTSKIIAYVKLMDNYKVEQQEIQQKPPRIKKQKRTGIQVV